MKEGGEEAVAVVLWTLGSTPAKAGARMVVDSAGVIEGTIGGGQVEAQTQRRAVEALRSGRAVVFEAGLEGESAAGSGPICGGRMRVLIDPAAAGHCAARTAAEAARKDRRRGVLRTTIRGVDTLEVTVEFLAEGAIPAALGFPGPEAIRSTIEKDEAVLFVQESPEPGQRLEVLVEPVRPSPLLVIAGGGHVGQALAVQAALVGFEVLVIDDRPEFTDPARFPGAATRCGDMSRELAAAPLDADTYVVLVTRGHRQDAEALAACLGRPIAYLGMIGSRRKVALLRKEFIESGRAAAEEFDRVYAPIGLDIGAVSVPEIAVSIAAQLVAVRRRGAAPRIPAR